VWEMEGVEWKARSVMPTAAEKCATAQEADERWPIGTGR